MEERRLSLRSHVSEEIQYNCMTCSTSDIYGGRVENISNGGMRMETDHALGEGQLIRIMTENLPKEPRYGSIVWTRQKEFRYEAGVNFLSENAVKDFVSYEESF